MQISPKEFVEKLDKKIMGQTEAKKRLAIALRNRWRRMQLNEDVRKDITPKNILMIGSTGVGKTAIIRAMAEVVDAPLLKVEATRYTQVGYYGDDVENMIHQLATTTYEKLHGKKPKPSGLISPFGTQNPTSLQDLLTSFIPEFSSVVKSPNELLFEQELSKTIHKIVKKVGYKKSHNFVMDNHHGFYRERDARQFFKRNPDLMKENSIFHTPDLSFLSKGLLPIPVVTKDKEKNKELSKTIIREFSESSLLIALYGYSNPKEEGDKDKYHEMLIKELDKIFNGKSDRDAIETFIVESINKTIEPNSKFMGSFIKSPMGKNQMDDKAKAVIDCIHEKGIIFIDEIDKLASSKEGNNKDNVGKTGVQRDLLALLDGAEVKTEYGIVKTENIMFIAAGAFSMNQVSDLMPELLGRLPIQVRLESMDYDMLKAILTDSENSPLTQHKLLLKTEGVDVKVTDEGIDGIARLANTINSSYQNMGARTLHAVVEKIFTDISYDAFKESDERTEFVIDKDFVKGVRKEMLKDFNNDMFKSMFQQNYGYVI